MVLGFYIVRFTNEADAPGIIPSNWLCSDGNQCFYPEAKNNEDRDELIRLKAEPQESWDTHPILIIGIYETYELARAELPVAELTSDLERHPEGKRRREKRILTLPEENKSDDEDIPPAVKKIKKTVCTNTNNFSQNMLTFNSSSPRPSTSKQLNQFNFNSNISEHAHNISSSTPHAPKVNSHNAEKLDYVCQMIETVLKKLVDMSNQMSAMQLKLDQMSKQLNPFNFNSNISKHAHNISPSIPHIPKVNSHNAEKLEYVCQMIEPVLKKILDMSIQMSSMELKLYQILERKENSNDDVQEKDFTEILPLRSMEDFNQLEQLLQEYPLLRKKMVKFLSLCGGRDIQKSVNNIMGRLMVDELAICYNLTGKSTKGLTKHPFVGTRLWQIVVQTCQNISKDTRIDKVRECVANWLHQSKTRIVRRAGAAEEIFPDEGIEQIN